MGLKYLVTGGYVISDDKERHYISAHRLVELYKVDKAECLMINEGDILPQGIDIKGLIVLGPDWDGKYELPTMPPAKRRKY